MVHAVRGDWCDPAATTKVNSYVATQYIAHGFNKSLANQIFVRNESSRDGHHFSSRKAQKVGLVTRIR